MRTLATLILLLSVLSGYSLSFSNSAPLFEHLLEVNALWSEQDLNDEHFHQAYLFENENQRIQAHIEEVCLLLEARNEFYSEADRNTRNHLISQLREYATAGVFPINTGHSFRLPYFIDEVETACAVGHLMIQNGYEDLALQVKKEMNNAYLREIPENLLLEWKEFSSLTLDEMALIQPGYPPYTFWTPHGEGIEGIVNTMELFDGNLIIAGDFSLDGNEANIASWDGTSLTAFAEVPNGEIFDLIEFEGQLHAIGVFFNGVNDVATWTGSAWEYGGAFSSKYAAGFDAVIFENDLYICGSVSGFAGEDYLVARKDGIYWTWIGQFDYPVLQLEVHEGEMFAGGLFQNQESGTLIPMSGVAKYINDGTWEQVGSGLPPLVQTLKSTSDGLYAGGNMFYQDDQAAFVLGRYQDSDWEEALDPADFEYWNGAEAYDYVLFDFEDIEGQVYVAGAYRAQSLMTYGGNVSEVQNDLGEIVGFEPIMGAVDGATKDLLEWNGNLYACGDFNSEYFQINHFASTPLINSVEENEFNFMIYPNPANFEIRITGLNETIETWELYTLEGKLLSKGMINASIITIDVSDLAQGSYILALIDQTGRRSEQNFVVQ